MRPKKNRPDSSTSCNSAYRAMETQIVGDVCAEFGSKRIAHRILRPEMFALMFRPRERRIKHYQRAAHHKNFRPMMSVMTVTPCATS